MNKKYVKINKNEKTPDEIQQIKLKNKVFIETEAALVIEGKDKSGEELTELNE